MISYFIFLPVRWKALPVLFSLPASRRSRLQLKNWLVTLLCKFHKWNYHSWWILRHLLISLSPYSSTIVWDNLYVLQHRILYNCKVKSEYRLRCPHSNKIYKLQHISRTPFQPFCLLFIFELYSPSNASHCKDSSPYTLLFLPLLYCQHQDFLE